jgi:hypothetical protein
MRPGRKSGAGRPTVGEVVPIGSPCEQRRTCWGSERLHFAPGPQPLPRGQGVHRPWRAPPADRFPVAEDRSAGGIRNQTGPEA